MVRNAMVLRLFSFLLLFLSYAAYSQVSVCSWNIENLGRSKSDSAESHTVFIPLKKMGYRSVFQEQKTTLKQKRADDNSCLASEFDNFFYNGERVTVIQSGAIHFYEHFASLKEAGRISDHIPIWFSFIL